MGQLRSRAREGLAARPGLTRQLGRVARRVGADGTADRLQGLAGSGEVVDLAIPARLPATHHVFRMATCEGRDQVVAALCRSWDDFERPMPDAFVALVHDRGGTVLDVGANTGLYSVLAAATRPDTTTVAFEPFPPVAALLRRNLDLNDAADRVEVVAVAIGHESGTAQLFVPDPVHGLVETSCSLDGSFKDDLSESVTVTVDTLDGVLAARPDLRPTVIKVDVESLEHAVLAGARRTLAEHRPVVFVEVLHVGDPAAIDRERAAAGYIDVRLRPEGLVVGEPVQHDPAAWNHLLVPAEQLEATLARLATVGLRPMP